MAVHARLGWRDPREPGILDRRVAVAAVDAVAGDVTFVAELNRLFASDARPGHPRRSVDLCGQAEQASHDEHRAENTDARDRVGAAVKDLRHRTLVPTVTLRDDRGHQGRTPNGEPPHRRSTHEPTAGNAESRVPIL